MILFTILLCVLLKYCVWYIMFIVILWMFIIHICYIKVKYATAMQYYWFISLYLEYFCLTTSQWNPLIVELKRKDYYIYIYFFFYMNISIYIYVVFIWIFLNIISLFSFSYTHIIEIETYFYYLLTIIQLALSLTRWPPYQLIFCLRL